MAHSEKLEETALWKEYEKRNGVEYKRCIWVKEVYEYAANYMKDVRRTFGNYTLHDETHIINVLDAMGGLLGDQIINLTVGELELLILAASLHDVGMVYTDEEKIEQYEDTEACKKFLKEYYPEFLGSTVEDWTEDMRQWYLRTLHSGRVAEVLHNKPWEELIHYQCPIEVVPLRCIIAVCEAHGYNLSDLISNPDLEYLPANDVSPLFCALLLRLGDLMDFDDTRAPKVLYSYVEFNEKSSEEWRKHQASAGFFYPTSPSNEDLPYKAHCTNPGVEHAIRNFLDWVEVELGNCVKLQKYCGKIWQQDFPFPRAILRNEIESDGYVSGDFCITMNQTKILELLTGENLYDNQDVFVRELLQNALDATLLREKMDPDFIPERSRIDFWEWNDKDGNIWFRIDDEGTGMTQGMLERYFLKVGNSYYTSREIERDLRVHNQNEKYYSISRFGIGFLSCFLNGDYAEVSTLYFDPDKNRREEGSANPNLKKHYGLRLQVTGLSGYYTLLNQSQNHFTNEKMPNPGGFDLQTSYQQERAGYRTKPGTSIAICLNPGKLGILDLKNTVEKYLCGARVPVYYNNQRIGQTYEEVMEAAHAVAGEKIYELTDEMKEQFDQIFPEVRGQYPKLVMTTILLDTKEDHVLQGVSGVFVKYEIHFEKTSCWQVKDLTYCVKGIFIENDRMLQMKLFSNNLEKRHNDLSWLEIEMKYSAKAVDELVKAFEKCDVCPRSEEQLGEAWNPFQETYEIFEVWKSYHDHIQCQVMHVSLEKFAYPDILYKELYSPKESIKCAYQGVYMVMIYNNISDRAYYLRGMYDTAHYLRGIFFLENECQPTTQASRSEVTQLPMDVGLYALGIINKYNMEKFLKEQYVFDSWTNFTRNDWKEMVLKNLPLRQWIEYNMKDYFEERIRFLGNSSLLSLNDAGIYINKKSYFVLFNLYQNMYLQDHKQIEINYEKKQIITFSEKKENESEEALDLFPPMLFCKAADEKNRRYLCSSGSFFRKGITMDHPFIIWLMKNAFLLNTYYKRQFIQIIDCLRYDDAPIIISVINTIRQQLMSLSEHHGVDVNGFPQLCEEDFYSILTVQEILRM